MIFKARSYVNSRKLLLEVDFKVFDHIYKFIIQNIYMLLRQFATFRFCNMAQLPFHNNENAKRAFH